MYWLFYVPLLLIITFILYQEYQTRKIFRQFIDIRTGQPVPIASGYFLSLYYLVRSRIDLVTAHRLKELGHKYGDYYAIKAIRPTLTLTNPEDIKNVFKKIDDFPKRQREKKFEFILKDILGPKSLVAVNGPEWHDQRTLMNKTFSSNVIFFEPVCKKVDLCISKWEDQSEVFVGHDLQKMTLDALATCIFGLDFDTLNGKLSEPLNAYNFVLERLFNPLRFVMPWINKIPIPFNTQVFKSLDTFDKYCWEIMAETKKKLQERKKNQSTEDQSGKKQNLSLIEAMYESGLDEESIRDNVSVFFLAGHETTSTALGWILSILVKNPEVQDKARKEVFEKIPNELTYDSLKELTYLDGLIKEGLRMHPPVPTIGGRHAANDTVIGNVRVPKDTEIDLNLMAMAHDPKIWGDPDVVRPERWLPENLTKLQRTAWVPFATGPRVCIGMNFSLLEQKIFLVYLLKRYKQIKLASNGQIKPRTGGFYAPDTKKLILQFVK